jgi:multidrug efflux pump subunit AcrA (membrane-fusion protein)
MPTTNNIRSTEVQEILGRAPSWMLSWGISAIFIIIAMLLIGSWYISYPDVIQAPVLITSNNPPVTIVANATGRITQLEVHNKQHVKAGELIAIIDNTANYTQAQQLIQLVDSASLLLTSDTTLRHTLALPPLYALGEMQNGYALFVKANEEQHNFNEIQYHATKQKAILAQINMYKMYYDRQYLQKELLGKDLKLTEERYSADSTLATSNVTTAFELKESQQRVLSKAYNYQGARASLTNLEIQRNQLIKELTDIQLDYKKQRSALHSNMVNAYQTLRTAIDQWKRNYIITSPIEGVANFYNVYTQNQLIKTGEPLVIISPMHTGVIFGSVKLPVANSAKVMEAQRVNIKLSNYPSAEFGVINGTVASISLAPKDAEFNVTVAIPQNLITSYHKQLPYKQEMTGVAEIITKDRSVFTRMFDKLYMIFKNE